jgi:NAD(P)-dependent dehydrogenase (short-subunit alcohol dehydrogenase family)
MLTAVRHVFDETPVKKTSSSRSSNTREIRSVKNLFSYQGKRVVITGAFSGVGAAAVELLSGLGASEIIAIDIKEPQAPISRFIETNMGDAAAIDAAAKAIDGSVDVLFNNAGIAATNPALDVMKVNYLGPRRLTEALLPKIPEGGAIAFTASIAGGQWAGHLAEIQQLLAITDREEAIAWIQEHSDVVGGGYEFSKECVQVYTMLSSKSTMAKGVRTNSLCPGPIDTPLLPDFKKSMAKGIIDWQVEQTYGKMATSEDVAKALVFLGTDASAFINGVNLNADLGFSAALATGQLDFSTLPS